MVNELYIRLQHFGRADLVIPEDEGIKDKCEECNCKLSEEEKDILGDSCFSCYNSNLEATRPKHPDDNGRRTR